MVSATYAELSSLAEILADASRRITAIGEGLLGTERETLGPDLFEVERTLGSAQRRLAKVVDAGRR
jgi:hypothetical protein